MNPLRRRMPEQAKALADATDAALDPDATAPALEVVLHAGDEGPVLDVPNLNLSFDDVDDAENALRLMLERVMAAPRKGSTR